MTRIYLGAIALLVAGCGGDGATDCPPTGPCREDVPLSCETPLSECRVTGRTVDCGEDPAAAPFWACQTVSGGGTATRCVRFVGGTCSTGFAPVRCPDDDPCCFQSGVGGGWPYSEGFVWPGFGTSGPRGSDQGAWAGAAYAMQSAIAVDVRVDAAVEIPDLSQAECSFPLLGACEMVSRVTIADGDAGVTVRLRGGGVRAPGEAEETVLLDLVENDDGVEGTLGFELDFGLTGGRNLACVAEGERELDSATVTLVSEDLAGEVRGRIDLVFVGGQRIALGF